MSTPTKKHGNKSKKENDIPVDHPERWRLGLSPVREGRRKSVKPVRRGDASTEHMSVIEFYKSAINCVRRKRQLYCQRGTPPKKIVPRLPALIPEDEVVDIDDGSWIVDDDDPPKEQKPRRCCRLGPEYHRRERMNKEKNFTAFRSDSSDLENEYGNADNSTNTTIATIEERRVNSPRKAETGIQTDRAVVLVAAVPSTAHKATQTGEGPKWRKFLVEIEDDVLLVPVMEDELDKRSIGWFMETVVERYAEIHGVERRIMLTTTEGWFLNSHDLMSTVDDTRIKVMFIDEGKFGLEERFQFLMKKAVARGDTTSNRIRETDDKIILEELKNYPNSKSLTVRFKCLPVIHASLALQALEQEGLSLNVLDLVGNCLGDDIIEPVMEYLKTQTIGKIDISENGITAKGIECFEAKLQSSDPVENLSLILRTDVGADSEEAEEAWTAMLKRKVKAVVRYVEILYCIKID